MPASFEHFDHAYCLTNHKAQGRTMEAAFVYVDPRYADREWSYVAASRSRFSTKLFVDTAALNPVDVEAHHQKEQKHRPPLELLADRMSRSRAKGTTLDYEVSPSDISPSAVNGTRSFFGWLIKNKNKKETAHEHENQPELG